MRPIVDSSKCRQCGECVNVCPGIEISQRPFDEGILPEFREEWGPVLEVWEGYATDPEIRYRGCGWPGMMTVRIKSSNQTRQMTYEQSWGN